MNPTKKETKPLDKDFLKESELLLNNGLRLKIVDRIGTEKDTTGLSFQAVALADWKNKIHQVNVNTGDSIFVKLPVPPRKLNSPDYEKLPSIRERFHLENEKGDLINHVANRCEDSNSSRKGIRFKIPFFITHSTIEQITPPTISESPDPLIEHCKALPTLIYSYVQKHSHGVDECRPGVQFFEKKGPFDPDFRPAPTVLTLDKCWDSPEIADPEEWFTFAHALVRVVQRIHNQGILHASICPRHIIKSEQKQFHLVGFGYSALCVHPPGENPIPLQDQPYRAPELNHQDGLDALWFPADLFSIGAILFQIATGHPPLPEGMSLEDLNNTKEDDNTRANLHSRPEYRQVSKLKEYVYRAIRETNKPLLQANENIIKIIDKCLRFDPNDRFSCAEEIIQSIQIAQAKVATGFRNFSSTTPPTEKPAETAPETTPAVEQAEKPTTKSTVKATTQQGAKPIVEPSAEPTAEPTAKLSTEPASESTSEPTAKPVTEHLSESTSEILAIALAKAVRASKKDNLDEPPPAFFTSLLDDNLLDTQSLVEHINNGHVEIFGHRDSIISSLCQILGSVERTAVYRTTTLPSYWTDKNLGSNGRFLTMNKHMAREGVSVQRVFLVPGAFHTLSEEEQDILEWQSKAVDDVAEFLKEQERKAIIEPDPVDGLKRRGELSVRVRVVDKDRILNFERAGNSVAYLSQNPEKPNFNALLDAVASHRKHLLLNFISQGQMQMRYGKSVIERQIKKVRFWEPWKTKAYVSRFAKDYELFETDYDRSIPVKSYIEGPDNIPLEDILKRGM